MAVLSGILLVWSLYFYEIKNWKLFILALPLALLGMEAPIIWGIFLTLYFFLRSDFKTSIFIAITSIIVTTLSLDGRVGNNLEYMELGRNSSEVLETIRNQPTKLLEILSREYFVQNYFDFLAKFPITAINPSSWLLVLPNFAERFLSINLTSWSNSTYYGFILAPLAIYISILSLYKVKHGIKSENIYKLLAISLLIPSLIFSLLQLSTSPNSKLKDILTQDNIEVVSEVNK